MLTHQPMGRRMPGGDSRTFTPAIQETGAERSRTLTQQIPEPHLRGRQGVGGPDDAYHRPASLALSTQCAGARKGFSPIDVDRTRQIRHAQAVAEEILLAFEVSL